MKGGDAVRYPPRPRCSVLVFWRLDFLEERTEPMDAVSSQAILIQLDWPPSTDLCNPDGQSFVFHCKMIRRPFSAVVFASLLVAPALVTASFVSDPAILNANDSIVWSQLGSSE